MHSGSEIAELQNSKPMITMLKAQRRLKLHHWYGERLLDAIGHERLEEICSLLLGGELKIMREEMLYWNR